MPDNSDKIKGLVHSEVVKAGPRTYFIDIKETQKQDYYISLTESTKKRNGDSSFYLRNKVFIYKEDVNKIYEAFGKVVQKMKSDLLPEYDFDEFDKNSSNNDSEQ
ncbi:MAG: DUF3276 family protein [Bacteroidia bacterium]